MCAERAAKMIGRMEKMLYCEKKKKVKDLNLFSLVKRIFITVHKYLHGEKILGNKRLFNLAEKGRTRTDCLRLNSDRHQSEIK